jgi:predicted TIM-barrel fold metal-dependent hydrolase
MPPSDYYRRQMFATFQRDEAGLLLADRIGVHTLMWGNDFPHGDGVWPDSRSVIDKQFAEVSADTRQAICLDNAARLYGFAV